jgi:hypothetical protein
VVSGVLAFTAASAMGSSSQLVCVPFYLSAASP